MVIGFTLGKYVIFVKTAIVEGDVPLLLSKPSLGAMGMIFDVAHNVADFTALSLKAFAILVTETGHPAIALVPSTTKVHPEQPHQWNAEVSEIQIVPLSPQYDAAHEAFTLQAQPQSNNSGEHVNDTVGSIDTRIFYPKKISMAVHNMLTMTGFCVITRSLFGGRTRTSVRTSGLRPSKTS